ncbi:hypothetical protein GCM10008955_40350 [Deinococcus malanensis]|uniref:GNAT family N-acetyltransferase n=1 Tax=Deinococcus malanensis TaxID=1706855 RepID=A0ABQ2F1Y5_9DEIO|nr:GNAT family N-acetyltransferase [Deinococcus malanensis]GGK42505.1 hypothetical protein GCM10008955_40350 [Deinococcus malanensis]
MTYTRVQIQNRSYDFLHQNHGRQGFELILFVPPVRGLSTLLRPPPREEVARLTVHAPNADELLVNALGFGYARIRVRVRHAHRAQGVGSWLLEQGFQEARTLKLGLAGELQALQLERARAFYVHHGARVVPRALHPDHPWLVWDAADLQRRG